MVHQIISNIKDTLFYWRILPKHFLFLLRSNYIVTFFNIQFSETNNVVASLIVKIGHVLNLTSV